MRRPRAAATKNPIDKEHADASAAIKRRRQTFLLWRGLVRRRAPGQDCCAEFGEHPFDLSCVTP
jgi:hypothetical protein